jgi:hypothetical protein
LVPAVRLTTNVGLEDLVEEHLRVAAKVGANPGVKIGSLVAGLVAGADTLDGMDLLGTAHCRPRSADPRPFDTGSFLRAFDHGNVRQLSAVHPSLTHPPSPPGADRTTTRG